MSNLDLKNYIGLYHSAIPANVCSTLVSESKDFNWKLFDWSNIKNRKVSKSEAYEIGCDTCELLPPKFKLILNPLISDVIEDYRKTYAEHLSSTMGFSNVKLNRYNTGTKLKKHVDHIHSLFDGQRKGIPTFSIVGLLNEDFEGGNFVFWDDYIAPLKTGTIVVFPSNFLYPHRVDTIKKGIRHSFVSWVW